MFQINLIKLLAYQDVIRGVKNDVYSCHGPLFGIMEEIKLTEEISKAISPSDDLVTAIFPGSFDKEQIIEKLKNQRVIVSKIKNIKRKKNAVNILNSISEYFNENDFKAGVVFFSGSINNEFKFYSLSVPKHCKKYFFRHDRRFLLELSYRFISSIPRHIAIIKDNKNYELYSVPLSASGLTIRLVCGKKDFIESLIPKVNNVIKSFEEKDLKIVRNKIKEQEDKEIEELVLEFNKSPDRFAYGKKDIWQCLEQCLVEKIFVQDGFDLPSLDGTGCSISWFSKDQTTLKDYGGAIGRLWYEKKW